MARALSRREGRRAGGLLDEARLQLAEFLLVTDGAHECARHAVAWLRAYAGAEISLCAAIDGRRTRLVGLTADGLTGRAEAFSASLEDQDHPLVAVLMRTQPDIITLSARDSVDGLRLPPGDYAVFPLHGLYLEEDLRAGVLVVAPASPRVVREGRWVASLLGPRLTRVIAYRASDDERRRLERERGLLQQVIDAAPDPVLLTDLEGRMVIANSMAEELFVSRDGDSEGRARAIALNNMLFSASLSWSATAQEAVRRRELLLADPREGSDLLFELMSGPVEDPPHGPGVVSILRNVTDLRRATEEIEENYRKLRAASTEIRADRDRLRLLIGSVADPILVTDPSGAIVLMNAPAERLFTAPAGTDPDVAKRVPSNDAHFSSFLANLLFAGDAGRYSGLVALTDPETGGALPFDATAAKVLSDHGELIGVVTILHDRTETLEKERLYEELKRASDELEEKVAEATAELVRQNELLRRQHIQLEQASALKSQFLANMSHEFRTPLNAIAGYTSMLLEGVSGLLNESQRDSLLRVESNARHLTLIINDILDISRIEAGKMPLHVTDCVLSELIMEAIAELQPIIARSKLAVSSEVEPAAEKIRSDRQKVKQIVLNLLSNALKFTREGSVQIVAWCEIGTDHVCIAVEDTGIGIDPAHHEKVFEDFQQVDSSPTREYGGTGLGLAICRRLAGMLTGRITLESALGAGSTFTLRLPRDIGHGR